MENPTYALPIPQWYFVLSSILLIMITLLFVGLCFLVFALYTAVKKIEQPVHNLLNKVDKDLVPKVETLMTKVEVLTDKVNDVAENARAISGTARGTVEKVSGGTSAITHSLASLAEASVSKLRGVAPYFGVAMAVFKMIQQFRAAKPAPVPNRPHLPAQGADAEPDKGIRTPVE